MSETLDFSAVDSAEGGFKKYFKPGIYKVRPESVELITREGGTPALKIGFISDSPEFEDSVIEERFFLSPKALSRIQYLHEKYFGVKLTEKAISFEKLEQYFKAKMLKNPKSFYLVVGGEAKDGRVFAKLPFSNFILDEAEERVFEEDSREYRDVVKQGSNASARSNSTVLSHESANDDLPWLVNN